MFELHWITAPSEKRESRRNVDLIFLFFGKVLIFTSCYRSHSPSRGLSNLLIFFVQKQIIRLIFCLATASAEALFSFQIHELWDGEEALCDLMCEVSFLVLYFFCNSNVTFMPDWRKNLSKQMTKGLFFTVRCFECRDDAKHCYLISVLASAWKMFKISKAFIKN